MRMTLMLSERVAGEDDGLDEELLDWLKDPQIARTLLYAGKNGLSLVSLHQLQQNKSFS